MFFPFCILVDMPMGGYSPPPPATLLNCSIAVFLTTTIFTAQKLKNGTTIQEKILEHNILELKIIDRKKKRQNTVEHIDLIRQFGYFLTIIILDDDDCCISILLSRESNGCAMLSTIPYPLRSRPFSKLSG